MSSKRHSILPAIDRSGPKPPVNFSSSLTISDNAILQGIHSITMQAETVVHPRSRVESHLGSILIGRRCLVHEQSHLGARPADLDTAKPGGVALADYVTVEAGCVIEAGGTEIGEGSIIQAGAKIGSGARIGKNCTITPMTVVPPGTILPDSTVIFSNGTKRIDQRDISDQKKLALIKQLAVLRKMIRSNPDKFK
ncbi:trimeric LpxA-like protein [Dactylonectria macrodidyma]|uniref:Dynactin subunit 6 n=1 Tax=Dactylonectria macrodidyma TaxID=307937 RepID=A0A9P9JDK3_9HYPO|nr:trimeric LpxA-like protein [Dactylonectria macrodidyma]